MPLTFDTRCCIAGGGPAGMMLGLLLARAGADVVALEEHADFLRDFRGDTVHPSTLEVIHELGLLDAFLARPHDKARTIQVTVGGVRLEVADFSRVRANCRFIAIVPQWKFLDFLRNQAERHPNFRLMMNTEATGSIDNNGKIAGVQAHTSNGPLQVTADLVIAADGRRSAVHAAAGLPIRDLGAPIDVLRMHISVAPGDPPKAAATSVPGIFSPRCTVASTDSAPMSSPREGSINCRRVDWMPSVTNWLGVPRCLQARWTAWSAGMTSSCRA